MFANIGMAGFGRWLLAVAAALGLCVAAANYLTPGNGIDHTEGALLVVGSTILILAAALFLAWRRRRVRWLVVLLDTLLLLGVLGTALAAWFLEAGLLLALMAVALLGWLLAVLAPPTPIVARTA